MIDWFKSHRPFDAVHIPLMEDGCVQSNLPTKTYLGKDSILTTSVSSSRSCACIVCR